MGLHCYSEVQVEAFFRSLKHRVRILYTGILLQPMCTYGSVLR